MRLIGGLLGYLAMLTLLLGGGALALLALSPGVGTQSKVAAYGAPTRVRAMPALADATPPEPQTPQRIGPAIVHRAPEPPSQAAVAKLRLQASGREMNHAMKESVSAQRRPRVTREKATELSLPGRNRIFLAGALDQFLRRNAIPVVRQP